MQNKNMRCPSNKYRVPHKIWDFIDDPSSIIIRSFISLFSDNFLLINAYYAIFPFNFSNFFAHLFVQYLLIFTAEFAHFFLQKGFAKMRNLSGEKKTKNFAQNVEVSRNDFSVLLKKYLQWSAFISTK